MKKILYIITLAATFFFASCSDELETNPTDRVSEDMMLETSEGGQAVLNGIYRSMYTGQWGAAWTQENTGIMAYVLVGDLMGEDHAMRESGQGWFYWDYAYGVRGDWTLSYGRQGQTWKYFYKVIANANVIISKEKGWVDSPYTKAVLGQAYAMRAYAYYFLINFFQQSYVEDPQLPGVPVYTEPTTKDTKGKTRGTVQAVYDRMNADIDLAVEYLYEAQIKPGENETPWVREHESYVDYYVANGIKARIALAQGKDYTRVRDAAVAALSKKGLEIASVSDFLGWNKKSAKNVMWAIEVITSQSEGFNGFFSHMDADGVGMYASKARQLIATGLYKLIPDTDERKKQWWRGAIDKDKEESGNSMVSYCQLKFRFGNPNTRIGDYLIMRGEEMLLMAAEAECRLGNYGEARKYLKELGAMRNENYAEVLDKLTNSNDYSFNTLDAPETLLEEILLQRRIELWGEFPRLFDLKRLKLGFDRNYTGSNHSSKDAFSPAAVDFVFPIPQVEFNGNDSIKVGVDQNPL